MIMREEILEVQMMTCNWYARAAANYPEPELMLQAVAHTKA